MPGLWDTITDELAETGAAAEYPTRPSARKSRVLRIAGVFLILLVVTAGSKDRVTPEAGSRSVAVTKVPPPQSRCVSTHSQIVPEASLVGMLPESLQSSHPGADGACSESGQRHR